MLIVKMLYLLFETKFFQKKLLRVKIKKLSKLFYSFRYSLNKYLFSQKLKFYAIYILQGNKISMIHNTHNYPPRNAKMSASSMFFPRTPTQNKFDPGFIPKTSINDAYTKSNQLKMEEQNSRVYSRGLISQSMIDISSSSSNNRVTLGKLDSMARVAMPTFQQDSFNQGNKSKDSTNFYSSSTAQSLRNQSSTTFKRLHNTFQSNYLQPETNPFVLQKRHQSINFNNLSKRQKNDVPSFLRKAQQGKNQVKTNNQPLFVPGDFKNKNLEFLKKRRQAQQTQQSMTGSMIGVQSQKVLPQYNNHLELTIKKPEFLSPNQNKFTTSINSVMCPEDRQKNQGISRNQAYEKSSNFQFKKKKLFESPAELATAKPLLSKQSITPKRELFTLKQKISMKNARQIKLQDFEILQKLGKGAFGDVFIAQEKNIGFICVIKKMSKKRIKQAKVEQHILRQIKIQTYLSYLPLRENQNLTSIFGYFHDADFLYLVLEALPDGSLQNVKKKKKLPQRQTANIARQVALGLKSMHDQYLIHRDLKPQNIFMHDVIYKDIQEIAKIGDFGCSIYNKSQVLRNTVVGCLEYSSPQQLSKEGYSEKIDSWCLGILTYQLLFGKSPFENDIIKIAKNKDLKPELSTLNFPPIIPIRPETKQFIQNLLNQDPDRRMDMDEALHHAFLSQNIHKKESKIEEFEFNDII